MGKYFRVGQTVYDVRFGKGVVTNIVNNIHEEYPIEVLFNKVDKKDYTHDGKFTVSDDFPSLFQNPIVTIPNERIVEFESGELVWVRTWDGWWEVAFYSHFEKGQHHCFDYQKKSGTTQEWKIVRKFEDNPLK